MRFEPIKRVSIICPVCNSGIALDIPYNNDAELQKTLSISETLACPKCKEKFCGARNLFDAIIAYNDSATVLNRYHSVFNAQFEY